MFAISFSPFREAEHDYVCQLVRRIARLVVIKQLKDPHICFIRTCLFFFHFQDLVIYTDFVIETEAENETETETEIDSGRQAGRQAYRQTGRQAYRQGGIRHNNVAP